MTSDGLSEADYARIERLCAAATAGPWKSRIEGRDRAPGSAFIGTASDDIELVGATKADQDFIASARQDVPALLDELRAWREGRRRGAGGGSANEEALGSLLEWWRDPRGKPCPASFSADFEFDSGIEKQTAEDWTTFCGWGGKWLDYEELTRIGGASRCALVFEVTEQVTLLRYRKSWLVDFDAGKLVRILETRSIIPPTPY